MPIFTNRLEAKLKELGVLEKAKAYVIKERPDDCDNQNINRLEAAFRFARTPEGFNYWYDIHEKTRR